MSAFDDNENQLTGIPRYIVRAHGVTATSQAIESLEMLLQHIRSQRRVICGDKKGFELFLSDEAVRLHEADLQILKRNNHG